MIVIWDERCGAIRAPTAVPRIFCGGEAVVTASEALETGSLTLRVDVAPGGRCLFSYSADGVLFEPIGEPFTARQGRWVGAKVGLFSGHPGGSVESVAPGFADFGDWRVNVD